MGDLISRDDLIKEIKKWLLLVAAGVIPEKDAVEDFVSRIENIPTVDAEPERMGKWILRAHDKGVNYLWTVTAYCSECCDEEQEIWSGYFPGVPDYIAKDVSLDSAKTVELRNYCPNCGAKMKEGSE